MNDNLANLLAIVVNVEIEIRDMLSANAEQTFFLAESLRLKLALGKLKAS